MTGLDPELVGQAYLDEKVLHRDADPHIVYVTGADDFYKKVVYPILEEVIDSTDGEMTVVEVDAFGGATFPADYQVLFVPTMFFFRRGEVQQSVTGIIPTDILMELAREACKPTTAETLAEQIRQAQEKIGEG
ncbi:hypothetical protein SEA_GUYFAGIERI_60 [Rhodococcus phage GuyFagieri]|nr:hypothetical protein SEA_GUYFAGIERI_60 [Rhodococcus phage GuyFagieri]